ncbi:hypothetical protein N866_01850 [Actinotalea ferrariae CF5-4]|uniref:Uncharacterized protein n=1 Tax=Actinotalea ferrariae CF5-4 TaxID=948458 RepID=A0A021VPY4_9CELL|nr:hypothetical protein [Actinotalea ferrariae]EYR63239.1 hypothetical protein N866_01850 [Actinotalea ferrariae CF5-4]
MLWFTVWTLLVLGTLVGAFFLGRDLYRKGRRLLAELERAGEVFGEVADRGEARAAELVLTTPAAVDLTDREPARARRALAAQGTARRRAARQARHDAAYARWRSFTH